MKLAVSARGHRSQTIVLVTTLLDPVAYPIEALGDLYFQRWSVELHTIRVSHSGQSSHGNILKVGL